MTTMTIAPLSSGPAPQDDGSQGPRQSKVSPAAPSTDAVLVSMREERLDSQVALFARAGYHIEQRSEFQAVMVREHKTRLSARIAGAVRTLGVVPLLTSAPRAFHRVLIRIDEDGAVQIL